MSSSASLSIAARRAVASRSTTERCSSSSLTYATPLSGAQRLVSGGMGRGDLYYRNPLSTVNRSRGLGVQRGLVHNSQCTQDQLGQLYYRKRVLHGSGSGLRSASTALCAPVATWSYIIPSLRQCLDGSAFKPSAAANEIEEQTFAEGQRLFLYEINKRLPLLEDSFADAELKLLVQWPALFQRAHIVLPIQDVEANKSPVVDSPQRAAEPPMDALSPRVTSGTDEVCLKYIAQGSGQHSASTDRIVQLTKHVMAAVQAELSALAEKNADGLSGKGVRLQEKMMRDVWSRSINWHMQRCGEHEKQC